jgi:hypothetical protein
MALVKTGEDPHLGLGLRWISGEVRTGVDGGDVVDVPGDDGEFDEVRAEAVKAIGLERFSGASRYVDGRRLEKLPCAGELWPSAACSIPCEKSRGTGRGGAP